MPNRSMSRSRAAALTLLGTAGAWAGLGLAWSGVGHADVLPGVTTPTLLSSGSSTGPTTTTTLAPSVSIPGVPLTTPVVTLAPASPTPTSLPSSPVPPPAPVSSVLPVAPTAASASAPQTSPSGAAAMVVPPPAPPPAASPGTPDTGSATAPADVSVGPLGSSSYGLDPSATPLPTGASPSQPQAPEAKLPPLPAGLRAAARALQRHRVGVLIVAVASLLILSVVAGQAGFIARHRDLPLLRRLWN